jgi:hypothetical protein
VLHEKHTQKTPKHVIDLVLPAALFGDDPAGLGGDVTAALDGDGSRLNSDCV